MTGASARKLAAIGLLASTLLAAIIWTTELGAPEEKSIASSTMAASTHVENPALKGPASTQEPWRQALGVAPADTPAAFEGSDGGGACLAGQVLRWDERPFPDVEVACWSGLDPAGEPQRVSRSDARGCFVLEGVGPEVYVVARSEGFLSVQAARGWVDEGSRIEGLRLCLARPASHLVRVRDEQGLALAGAKVELQPVELQGNAALTRAERLFHVRTPGPVVSAVTAPGGEVLLTDLVPGAAELSVRHPGDFPWSGRIEVGGEEGETEVVLRPSTTLRGLVIAPDASPVAGAELELRRNGIRGRARTDRDGRFSISDAPVPSRSWLSVQASGFAIHVREPVLDEESSGCEIIIQLESAHALAGVVQDVVGNPLPGLEVQIEGDRWIDGDTARPLWKMPTWETLLGTGSRRTDEDGSFRFDGLYPGSFRIAVSWNDGLERRQFFEAPSGSERLVLEIDPSRVSDVSLHGRVIDALSAAPVPRFTVTVLGNTPEGCTYNSLPHEFEQAEGRFAIGGLRPMELSLFVSAPGYRDTGWPPELRSPGRHELIVELRPTRFLSVRAVDPWGEPVPSTLFVADGEGRHLWIPFGPSGHAASIDTDEAGEALIQNLPAGRVTLSVWPRGVEPASDGSRAHWEFEFDLSRPLEGTQALVLAPP